MPSILFQPGDIRARAREDGGMDATSRAQHRAAAAERAVGERYLPRWGPVAAARAAPRRTAGARVWHYWWHAHLLDALGDAERHRPSARRRRRARAIARGVAVRTAGRWTTPFYDDIAWMGLALWRTDAHPRALARIADILQEAVDPVVGALPWRVGSDLYNAPANGPAALLLAGLGRPGAAPLADWVASTLHDPVTGLVRDGIEHGRVRPEVWTYNQGTAIGADLAVGGPARRARAAALVAAVDRWCAADDGLFPAAGGGDGGLFAGILARALAQAAGSLDAESAETARRLVHRNADALWDHRGAGDLFPADPRRGARSGAPDHDLSVQLSAWLTLEAAVDVERRVTN